MLNNPNPFKNYCIKVPFNGITCPPNFMKIYQSVQKLLGVGHRDRQIGNLISLTVVNSLGITKQIFKLSQVCGYSRIRINKTLARSPFLVVVNHEQWEEVMG
jgi:hypothetical protein